MRLNSIAAIGLSAIVISLLLAGCGGGDKPESTSAASSSASPADGKKVLNYVVGVDPRDLNPINATNFYQGEVNAMVFDTLVAFEEGTEAILKPSLADSWDISPDGLEYTFHLRPGAKYSNGDAVVAGDVKAAFERLLDAGTISPRANFFYAIKGARAFNTPGPGRPDSLEGVQVIDDHTVKFILEKPSVPFIQVLAMANAAIYPDKVFRELGAQKFGQQPIGGGPWKIAQWRPEQAINLVPNEHYWGPQPQFDELVYKINKNDQAIVSEFEVGAIDVITIPENMVKDFREKPKFRDLVVENQELNIYFCGIMTHRPPTDNPRLREAICYAVNADNILQFVNLGQGIRAHGPVPPGIEGYRSTIMPWPHDPARARAIIAEIGAPETPLLFWTTTGEFFTAIAEAVKSDLEKAGLKVTLVRNDFSSFQQGVREGVPDMYVGNWWADYPDIENFIQPIYHSSMIGGGANGTHYSNPELDQIIDAAERMTDNAARIAKYQEAEDIIRAANTHIFLWHGTSYRAHQPWVKGYGPAVIYNSRKFLDISIDKSGGQ